MRNLFTILIIFSILLSCANKKSNPVVKINTSVGNIFIELYAQKAPKTTALFLKNVDEKLYDNGSFYRVLNVDNQPSDAAKSELIQGGIWLSNTQKAQSMKIPHESNNITNILHTRGTVSLARQDTGNAGSEFFILLKDDSTYDYGGSANNDKQGYAAFGKVIRGMDVVYKIYNQPTSGQRLQRSIPIYKMRID